MGTMDMIEFLRPWLIASATNAPVHPAATQYTGAVIDVRNLGMKPCFRPTIYDESGAILYDGAIWSDAVLSAAPVRYVSDASDSDASRAGESPVFLRAHDAGYCRVDLNEQASAQFRAFAASDAIGRGVISIVIEAE